MGAEIPESAAGRLAVHAVVDADPARFRLMAAFFLMVLAGLVIGERGSIKIRFHLCFPNKKAGLGVSPQVRLGCSVSDFI